MKKVIKRVKTVLAEVSAKSRCEGGLRGPGEEAQKVQDGCWLVQDVSVLEVRVFR